MLPDTQTIIDLGVTPVSAETPGGSNLQDDYEFDTLTQDVQSLIAGIGSSAEMRALGERSPATWTTVAERATNMLKARSKDLRLASFLAIALMNERGMQDLPACLELLRGMLANFWDGLFPVAKMMKGRVNAFEYIAAQRDGDEPWGALEELIRKSLLTAETVRSQGPRTPAGQQALAELAAQVEALRGARETAQQLCDVIREKFPSERTPDYFLRLPNVLNSHLLEGDAMLQQLTPPPAAAAPEPAASSAPAPAAARPAAAPAAAMPAPQNVDDVRRSMGAMGSILRSTDPTDPAAYRLLRWSIWGMLTAPPPTSDGRHTLIPDVQSMEVDSLRALLQAQNWLVLLNQAEERMEVTPLWFDRQFFVWSALNGLGPGFRSARDAVANELGVLLKRVPALKSMAFADGMPFADDATTAWIDNTVMAEGSGGGGARMAVPAGDGDGAALAEAMNEARNLLQDGDLAGAIRRLQAGPQSGSAQSGRSRFLWRMAQAQLAQEAGRGKQMLPLWQDLIAEIDRHQLEVWEPDLCMQVFRTVWQLTKADKEGSDFGQTIYQRLCRLDPAAALDI